MINNNYPYGLFNINEIQQYNSIPINQQIHDAEQRKHIAEMVKAISDYCDAAKKITYDYQRVAMEACIAEIITQMNKQQEEYALKYKIIQKQRK